MKFAIVGSRNLTVENLDAYLPEGVTEIVSGGARGVDACARMYAQAHGIPITEFLPDYPCYGRGAPFRIRLSCAGQRACRSPSFCWHNSTIVLPVYRFVHCERVAALL